MPRKSAPILHKFAHKSRAQEKKKYQRIKFKYIHERCDTTRRIRRKKERRKKVYFFRAQKEVKLLFNRIRYIVYPLQLLPRVNLFILY